MTLELYVAYVVACVLIAIIPGPTVTVIIANSLKHGARAGMLNAAGTQFGLALMMVTVAAGLASVIAAMGWLFDWLRYAGAAYLVWLGWRLIRSTDLMAAGETSVVPRGGFFLQGLVVILANPKALLLFGALIPQFIDPAGDYVAQIALLGATFMVIAGLTDGAYALLTGRAGRLLSARRVRLVSRLSGACLIGGGVWLALTRAR